MMVYETGDMLFGKVDIENVKIYEAIMVLLTKIKEDLVLRMVPRFPSKMVMVGVLFQQAVLFLAASCGSRQKCVILT